MTPVSTVGLLLHLWLGLCLCIAAAPFEFEFNEVQLSPTHEAQVVQWRASNASLVFASSVVKQPVYVSIATIRSRIARVHRTITSIFEGPLVPDRVFLFISREAFLLDAGVQPEDIPAELAALVTQRHWPVSIVYTQNLGSHRKLLPLLARKWDEDCAIATFDDEPKDEGKLQQYLQQLVRYYLASGREAVVSLKARRLGVCRAPPYSVRNYGYWTVATHGRKELLLLPTGTGSVLYRPRFFHPVVFDPVLRNLTHTADDLMFRLATLARGVRVVTGCREEHIKDKQGGMTVVPCPAVAQVFGPDGDPGLWNASLPQPQLLFSSSFSTTVAAASARPLHHRRLQSLSQLNLHKQGNDRAWRNATAYLLTRGLLNLTSLALGALPHERGRACDPLLWEQQPLRKRTDELGRRLLKQRRECALTFCRSQVPTAASVT